MEPSKGICEANEALSLTSGSVLIVPRQFGPTIRMEYFCAREATWSSSAAPSCPISLKPAEITMRPLTPSFPHSSVTAGTAAAGTTTTATSTLSGKSPIEGYDLTPLIEQSFGLTG